jgi:hypothetical protein
MNRPGAALVLFLVLCAAPAPLAASDCLSGGPTLPELVASQPDLAALQTDMDSRAGTADADLAANVQ